MKEKVLVARQTNYRLEELEPLMDGIFREFGLYDRLRPGMTVVLKPNLIMRGKPEAAFGTHPAFVAAVGRCVRKAGAEVLIAESPGGVYTPQVIRAHFQGCGYRAMAEENGFSLYTDCKYREVSLPEGVACREMAVIEPFLDADFLIDLAKLKTHSMTGYSGAVKNLFGTVPGLQKPELHCRFPNPEDFSTMLVDLCAFLRPGFSLIDGIWAMEGDGPTGGTRREAGLVIAGKNPFAADVCGTALIGIRAEQIAMLRLGHERGLGPISPEELDLVGPPLETLRMDDFKKARAASIDFVEHLPRFLRPMAKKLATPYPRISRKGCVGCGRCAESCPQHTISIRDKKAQIDYRRCIHCFCCHEMCPQHVIDVRRWGAFRFMS